jgi:hypothetical protein
MLVHDDIFSWEGFGGKLRLANGKCRLKIFDLSKGSEKGLAYIRPIIAIVSDVPDSNMSVRSCSSHIATMVTKEFNMDPNRMLFIEYYPSTKYGESKENVIAERYEAVDFTWYQDKAVEPTYRKVTSPLLETIKELNEGPQ